MTAPAAVDVALPPDVPADLFVAGEWRPAGAGACLPVEDPGTGDVIANVADAEPADAFDALAAAHGAFPAWRATAPRARSELLRRAYEALVAQRERLALIITLEMGKPLREARGEVDYAAAFLRWYAEEAVRLDGRTTRAEHGAGRILTFTEPVGPCLFVTPWNFPLAMGTRKLAPALAAGCTVVVKPASQAPLSMLALARILQDAGTPAGVVNVVTTSRTATVVPALLADARLRKLSFTGSTSVGKRLIAASAHQVLRVSMELGGNAPFLVFEDADLDAAVEGALLAKLRNNGEACTSANRFYVHAAGVDEFTARLVARMSDLRVGHGAADDTDVGPLIDRPARDSVGELVADAVDRGAQVACGTGPVDGPGWFFSPTVLTHVPADARALHEEIFGPVAPIVAFEHDDEAIAVANDTSYGLVAYVYTRDVSRALHVADALETGMVGLNQGIVSSAAAPFGGVKQSGYGREGGPEGLAEYVNTKYVALAP